MKIFKYWGFSNSRAVETWELDNTIFSKIDPTILDDVLDASNKRFESTVDDINRGRDKAFRLLTVFISLLSVLVALYYNESLVTNRIDKLGFNVLFSIDLVIVALSILQLVSIVKPGKMMLKGEEPKESSSWFVNLAKEKYEVQRDSYKRDSFKVVQDKIEHNESVLEEMNDKIESVITTTSFVFIFTLVLSLWIIK